MHLCEVSNSLVLVVVWQPLLVRESRCDLVLHDHLLERVSIEALPLVVAEYLRLELGRNDFVLLAAGLSLLGKELFNAAAVDLELLACDLLLSRVLIPRNHRVKLEGALVWSLQVGGVVLHIQATWVLH